MFAALDPLQWILAATAMVSAVASLGGFLLQKRKDDAAIDHRAGTVAAEVTEAALNANNAALARAEKDIKHLTVQLGGIRTELREVKTDLAKCETEKAVLARENVKLDERVRILEAAT